MYCVISRNTFLLITIIVGLFHVESLTLSESLGEITCTFVDSSNSLGCRVVLFCYETVLCDFRITKESGSSSASRTLPLECCLNNQSCSIFKLFAYDILQNGTTSTTVAKYTGNITYNIFDSLACSILVSATSTPSNNSHNIKGIKINNCNIFMVLEQVKAKLLPILTFIQMYI